MKQAEPVSVELTMKKGIPVQEMNINHRALPVFADRSIVASQVASQQGKSKKKALKKEGTIRLLFVDSVSNQTVGDVVMTSIAAEQLVAGVKQSLERLATEVNDLTIPSQEKPDKQQAYIG